MIFKLVKRITSMSWEQVLWHQGKTAPKEPDIISSLSAVWLWRPDTCSQWGFTLILTSTWYGHRHIVKMCVLCVYCVAFLVLLPWCHASLPTYWQYSALKIKSRICCVSAAALADATIKKDSMIQYFYCSEGK